MVLSESAAGRASGRFKDRLAVGQRQVAVSYTHLRLLDASCNLLFRDVFSSLKICARVPFFLECSEAASLSRAYRDYGNPVWIAEAVETGNPEEIRRRFRTMSVSYTHLDVYKRQALK